jgi:hypothetical protein
MPCFLLYNLYCCDLKDDVWLSTMLYHQGVTKRCRLYLLTNCPLVYESQSQCGGGCGVSANEYSCAHHVTWSPNKLWRSTSIFNLCLYHRSWNFHHRTDHAPPPPSHLSSSYHRKDADKGRSSSVLTLSGHTYTPTNIPPPPACIS